MGLYRLERRLTGKPSSPLPFYGGRTFLRSFRPSTIAAAAKTLGLNSAVVATGLYLILAVNIFEAFSAPFR
jgi:hypothetical protein